ncbi:ABC transporter permease [Duganella sp. HH105]|uniref:ABC transporter permease n=1 Tax=Duganella sp. HH105 TaxID=1781067 RepID=UPI000877CFF7|nr:ABC transporter permease [Duganella sp. HH105]OEZ59871.1 macrolide export ATP-binding/permease protein MacB [Duganella sp. HH105]
MNLRDFRIGWRLLLQQPAYSAVVIGGLAIGFAACFLLFGFVDFCINFNSTIPDNDRVVMIKQRINVFPRPDWQTRAFIPLRDVAIASGMVSEASIAKQLEVPVNVGSELRAVDLQVVDPGFASMFGIAGLQGDLAAALTQPDGLALTRAGAQKLFGSSPAIGQTVRIDGTVLQVRALLPNPPANSSQQYEALVGTASSAWPERETAISKWGRATIYMKLKPGASMAELTALLQEASEKSPVNQRVKTGPMGKGLNGRNVADISLLPLRDVYFDEGLANSRAGENYGQRGSVFGMAAAGLLILLLAAINYVNLATVRTLRRQREIGIRKLLGASAARLVRQFLSEAALTSVLAAAAGLVLAWLLLPTFADLVNRPLGGTFTPLRCAIALAFGLFIGVCAGAYPAWLAQHALPGPALAGRGNSETAAGLWVRRVLTVVQFSSAMALSASALAVGWQTWFAMHASPGFDPAHLLVLDLPSNSEGKPEAVAFIEQLGRLPRVEGVASISEAVGRDGMKLINTVTTRDGREIPLEGKNVSANWFEVSRLQPLHGRLYNAAQDVGYDKAPRAVVNTAAALALGYASPQDAVGKVVPGGMEIVGVAPDVRFQGLHQPAKAVVYFVRPGGVLTIRTRDSLETAYTEIEPLWRRHFPNAIMEMKTQQGVLEERYATEARLIRILTTTSVIAIALAAFGIYVLSAYSVQRSRREIVMRKLHGAGRVDIALMMGREFSALVGAGALIGLPLAAVAIQRYLAHYTEHAPIGIWTLLAALAMAMLVALLATTRHTATALRMSPALALRD